MSSDTLGECKKPEEVLKECKPEIWKALKQLDQTKNEEDQVDGEKEDSGEDMGYQSMISSWTEKKKS